MSQQKSYPTRQHTATIDATVEETGFWIARAQPLHLGHIDAIKQGFAAGIKKILIGIGSADKHGTDDNPFNVEERKKMIIDVLEAEGLLDKCSIYYVMDAGNNHIRRQQIENEIEPFAYLISDNDYLTGLFPGKKFIKPLTRINTRGTIIRNAIFQKERAVLHTYLHPMTLKTLEEINAYEKIKQIFGPEMMKPKNASDLVVKDTEGKVILIERKHPPLGRALPGGMMDYGESALQCALREGCEELGGEHLEDEIVVADKTAKRGNFEISLVKKLSYLDNPNRDPRGHTISFPFEFKILSGNPKAADDAKSTRWFTREEIESIAPEKWAFPDHKDAIKESYE